MIARHGLLPASWRWLRSRAPERGTLRPDLVAGVAGTISSVPDGMAASVLAGVNPVHGLYASIFGPIGGGLTSSSRLMVITTTSAAALAAGSAVQDVPEADRGRAMLLLTVLAGALMAVAALLRLGRFTRFVPHSVMIGFLTGVAANILFSQLPGLVGADISGPYPLAKSWHLVLNPRAANLPSLAAGALALAILGALGRTKIRAYSSLVALAVPSALVVALSADSVQRVRDVGQIPQGLPTPTLPQVSDLSLPLVAGAFSVAVLVLIQGAGVSESAPNPDGSRSDANQDFAAQGVGNLLSGLFRGQPVGGSVGQTAVSVAAGARGRWAAISAGIWMAAVLVAFSKPVAEVAMPTLAAVLIFAAVGSLRTGALLAILRTGPVSRIAVIATFAATLFLPVATAVALGVTLSLLMQLNQEALDLRIVELVPDAEGVFSERISPATLPSKRVILLDVYGSLYYAGARTLQAGLPDPGGADQPAVVLRLRGRTMLGATSFAVLSDYATRLSAVGGRFYLSGVDPAVLRQLRRTRGEDEVTVFEATSVIGEASLAAYHDAEAWVARPR